MSQLCLWSQRREAGRGKQTGCSGPAPGHTLRHTAQERPWPDRGRTRDSNLKTTLGCATALPPDTSGPFCLVLTPKQTRADPELEWPQRDGAPKGQIFQPPCQPHALNVTFKGTT